MQRQLGLGADATLTITGFAEEEIIGLAENLGCAPTTAKKWSRLIAAQTNSHPQLVHARLLTLARAGWPPLREEDLLQTPRELTEERAQTRMLLSQLPAGDVELLYRLSLVAGVFRRDHAVAIGEIETALATPGDVFDRLVGRWIEPVSQTYYRLSPLLQRAADAVWSADKANQLREAVGEALLRCRKLTLIEANTILMLGFLTRSQHLVFVMTNAFLKQPLPLKRHVAESISWMAHIKTDPCVPIFAKPPLLNWMLRLLQFHVAMSIESDAAAEVVECLDQETTVEHMGDGYLLARFLFLTQTLVATQVRLSAAKLLYLIGEADKARAALMDAGEEAIVKSFEANLADLTDVASDFATRLFLFVVRCDRAGFLDDLMSALRGTDDSVRMRFRAFINEHPLEARLLVDRAWSEEANRSKPDWERCIAALKSAADYGRAFDVEALTDLAVRAIMIVADEYLNDRTRAFREFDSLGALIASPSALLLDEYAHLLTNDGKHTPALEIWERILPDWTVQEQSHDSLPAFARRRAAIAAARAGKLERSSKYFKDGADQAGTAGEPVLSAGMLADAAFVEWKQGRKDEAISLFTDVVQRLDEMPNTKDELTSFKLRKLTGQMLSHIRSACAGRVTAESYAPPIGSASDLDASDRLRELPVTNSDMLWLLLLQTEAALRLPPRAFEVAADRLATSKIPAVTWFLAEVDMSHKLRSSDIGELPILAERFSDSYDVISLDKAAGGSGVEPAERRSEGSKERDDADRLAPQALFAGLISVTERTEEIKEVLDDWRQACETLRLRTTFLEWIELRRRYSPANSRRQHL